LVKYLYSGTYRKARGTADKSEVISD